MWYNKKCITLFFCFIEIIAYNEKADYCIQSLKTSDIVFVYGEVTGNIVNIKEIEKFVLDY